MSVFTYQPCTITYPKMERQDLTQGQLGSFKFTPTDEVKPQHRQSGPFTTVHFTPDLTRTIHHSKQPSVESLVTSHLSPHFLSHSSASSRLIAPATNNLSSTLARLRRDHPQYFENCVKRLTIDPSSAVNSLKLNSPANRRSEHTKTSTRELNMSDSTKSLEYHTPEMPNGLPSFEHMASAMDPPDTFFPASASQSDTASEVAVQASILRALSTEQQAHSYTRYALNNEQALREASEERIKNLEQHNESLLRSINMLKSANAHYLKLLTEAENESRKTAARAVQNHKNTFFGPVVTISVQDTGGASREPEGKTQEIQARPSPSILQEQAVQPDVSILAPDDSLLYDFDLFSSTFETNKLAGHETDALKPQEIAREADQLVDLGPSYPSSSSLSSYKGRTSREPARLGRRNTRTNVHVKGRKDSTHRDLQNQTSHAKRNTDADIDQINNSLVQLNIHDSGDDELKVASVNLPFKEKPILKSGKMSMPFSPDVDWEITESNPIYNDEDEKWKSAGRSIMDVNQETCFLKHPVRYIPDIAEKNQFRTVMIDFIPTGTTYGQILDQIRGGQLESIYLYPPIGNATSFTTARVVFSFEREAQNLYLRGQEPGLYIDGKRLRIWQVLQPTYPNNPKLDYDIFEQGFTRILLIRDVMPYALGELPQKLAAQINAKDVLEMGQSSNGIHYYIEFTSIAQAGRAWQQLVLDPDFTGAKFSWDTDPCTAKY